MRTEILKVTGLTSEQCIDTITRALASVAGVRDVRVSLLRSQIAVQYDERLTRNDQLEAALAKAGYDARAEVTLDQGSCCGGCCG